MLQDPLPPLVFQDHEFHSRFFGSEIWEVIAQASNVHPGAPTDQPDATDCLRVGVERTRARLLLGEPGSGMSKLASQMPLPEVFELLTLWHKGSRLRLSSFGAAVISWELLDPTPRDVVLGFDNQESYFSNAPYFGVAVGPCSNRIPQGRYTFNEKTYQLCINEESGEQRNHLHGGFLGFHKKLWEIRDLSISEEEIDLTFWLDKPAGEDGYPGKVTTELKVQFRGSESEPNESARVSESGSLKTLSCMTHSFDIQVSEPTPISPTMHHYFNLTGEKSVENHRLSLNTCSQESFVLGDVLKNGGLDQNFYLMAMPKMDLPERREISCTDLLSETQMSASEIRTSQIHGVALLQAADLELSVQSNLPCVQVYTFNDLSARYSGKTHYGPHSGVCLETQFAPGLQPSSDGLNSLLVPGMRQKYVTAHSIEKVVP